MIKRTHIRQFLAVVDAGSFTQAAARIRVTQPTLSAGIAELERLTGTALLVRDRRRVRLTEAGGQFLPIARALEQGFREADDFGRATPPEWPQLRIGLLRTVPDRPLRAFVAALGGAFSMELVEGTDSELRAGLGEGRLQLALTLLRADDPDGQAIKLVDEPYVMIAAAGHPLARRDMLAPEDLAAQVMLIRRNCEMLAETSRFFTRHKVRPRFALRSESDARCIAMVAAGLGITNVPRSLAGEGTAVLDVRGYMLRRRLGLRLGRALGPDVRAALMAAADAFRAALDAAGPS